MFKRSLAFLSGGLLTALLMVGCVWFGTSMGEPANEIPDGEKLQDYTRAVVEIESQEELEN